MVWGCLPFLAGLLGAVVLAVLAAPSHRRLAPRVGSRRAAILLTVGAAVLLATPVIVLLPLAIQQAPVALRHLTESDLFSRLATLRIGDMDVGAQVAQAGAGLLAWGSGRAMSAAGSLTRVVLNLLLALVGLYYLLPGGAALWEHVRELIPFSRSGTEELAERFVSITRAAVLGVLATALSQGLTVGLAFRLVSLPNPFFWGAITALVSILPILGSSLVWAPGVAVLLADGRPAAAIVLALIGFVIASNVDNVVRPIVYRRVSGLHPMAALLGAFAGLKLLGLAGLLLGPLALAYCMELYQLYRTEYGAGVAV